MGATLTQLDRIAEPMRGPIREYADLIHELAGPKVKALTLFGAIAGGTFDMSRHTARNVLVLQDVDLTMLRRLSENGVKLGKAHIAAPLVMTPSYIEASLDTFPLELIEIKQQHLTILGEDHFAELEFDDAHVRLQCERELKASLIRLRQGLLAAAGRRKVIGEIETDAAEGLLRTLRGLLWLKGKKKGMPMLQVLSEVEELTGRKLAGLRTALDPAARHEWDEFTSLYRDVETLGGIADAW